MKNRLRNKLLAVMFFTASFVVCPDIVDAQYYSLTLTPSGSGLVGEEIAWYANLSGVNPDQVMWSFTYVAGSGSPSSGSGTTYMGQRRWLSTITAGSTDVVQVKVDAWYAGQQYTKTSTMTAVKPEVTEMSWINDPALPSFIQEIPLKKWPTGTAITDPVWKKPLGSTTLTKEERVCYIRNKTAHVELKIEANSPLQSTAYVEVKGVGVDGYDENFASESASFLNWNWSPGELVLESSTLYYYVNYYAGQGGNSPNLDVIWYYRVYGQTGWGSWIAMNQTSQRMYIVHEQPRKSMPYDLGVEYGTQWAKNMTNHDAIADAICIAEAAYCKYSPFGAPQSDVFKILDQVTLGVCYSHCFLFEELLESITAKDAVVKYRWGGTASSDVNTWSADNPYGPGFVLYSMQLQHDEGDVPANSLLSYHADVEYNGKKHDPSFGINGPMVILKYAPSGVVWQKIDVLNNPSGWPSQSGTSPSPSLQTGAYPVDLDDFGYPTFRYHHGVRPQ